jgi:ATP-dependent helicase HrpA
MSMAGRRTRFPRLKLRGDPQGPADRDLLGHIGLVSEEDKNPQGATSGHIARGIRFYIHPGSSLVKKAGRWIVAAEMVETSRLFARCVAKHRTGMAGAGGRHLIRKHVYEPHWEKGPGQVVAWERVTLHGLMLHAKRRVHYGPSDPKLAREILIREALVEGQVGEDWVRKWRFFQHNAKLMKEIQALEHKSRRPDVLVDDELIHAFYDARIPEGIITLAAFDHWRREAEAANPKLLCLEKEQLMRHEAAGITTDAFSARIDASRPEFQVELSPRSRRGGRRGDAGLPLTALNQLSANRCEWLVPGLLKEKVLALLKTLQQKYRHRLQPLDDSPRISAMPSTISTSRWCAP